MQQSHYTDVSADTDIDTYRKLLNLKLLVNGTVRLGLSLVQHMDHRKLKIKEEPADPGLLGKWH